MGSYANLTVGRISLDFKYEAPAFLSFLFRESEYYGPAPPSKERAGRESEGLTPCGYRTTASIARATMDSNGLSEQFFAEVLDTFRPYLEDLYHDFVTDELAEKHDYGKSDKQLEREYASSYRSRLLATRSAAALRAYVEFLRSPPEGVTTVVGEGIWAVDFEQIQSHFTGRLHEVQPGLALMLLLLDESFFMEYPDVAQLLFLRLALESVPNATPVELDLSEVVENISEAREFHERSAEDLVQRIRTYNQTFRVLLSRQESVREQVTRRRCQELLERASRSKTAVLKGRALEDLIEALFGLTDELQLQGRRVSTKDEEIDLVFRNRLKSPFWLGFTSPLILVECKNWRKRVDAKAVRDFETKVRNRGKTCRLAFCVGMNGFTRAADEALRRAGREPYHIVPISGASIGAFLSSAESFNDWLESRAGEVK